MARRPRAAGATSSCWKSFIEFLTQEGSIRANIYCCSAVSSATRLIQLKADFYTPLSSFDTGIAFFLNESRRSEALGMPCLGSDDSRFCAFCHSPRLDPFPLVTVLLNETFFRVLAESSENRLAQYKKKGCKKSKCSKWKGGTCRCGR